MALTLKTLHHQRAYFLGMLTKLISDLENEDAEHDEDDLQDFRERLEEIGSKHEKIIMDCFACDDVIPVDVTVADDRFQEPYNRTMKKVKAALKATSTTTLPGTPSPPKTTPKIKLPTIELPKFDGSPETWISFRDLFLSIVHNNQELTGSTKFRYLKTSIIDKLSPVAHRTESDDGYEDAWKAVLDCYDDKRRLMDKHIEGILAAKKMNTETHEELLKLLNDADHHISALEREKEPKELFYIMVAHIYIQRLDANTRNLFETDNKGEIPQWKELKTFLENRRKVLSTLPAHRLTAKLHDASKSPPYSPLKNHQKSTTSYVANTAPSTGNCLGCKKEGHRLFSCPTFIDLTVPKRLEKVKELKLCFNCFGLHPIEKCMSKYKCSVCQRKHHTLLHKSQGSGSEKTALIARLKELQDEEGDAGLSYCAMPFQPSTSTNLTVNCAVSTTVFLSTAIVKIQDSYGQWHRARALLDSGSDANFITKSLADVLRVKTMPTLVYTNGFGEKQSVIDSRTVVAVASGDGAFEKQMDFLINNKVTGRTPSTKIDISRFNIPKKLKLADPSFATPGKIDILIGNEWFIELLLSDRIELPCGPMLQATVFGYIVAGRMATSSSINTRSCNVVAQTQSDLIEKLEKFYKDEDYRTDKRFLTAEETFCESHFEQTHKRSPEGRFIVEIPIKENISQLANNKNQAMCQFIANEKRLQKNERLYSETRKFMKEYEDLNHMTEVKDTSNNGVQYFLPHHGVEKPDSTTTKVRVVFNASSKTKSGLSFNDCQYNGPTVQNSGFNLVIKFRSHAIVIKGDIAKMYRQVEVVPEHRHFQQILWRESPIEPIRTFQLNTVTYGTKSGSFLATRCLKQLGIEHREVFPAAAAEVENAIYVDDLMSGEKTLEKAVKLFKEVDQIISSGAMKLRKIASNCPEFMQTIPEEDRETFSDDMTLKALGIKWNPNTDQLEFDINPIDAVKVTRSSALSEIMKIYDPEGLLGPVTFRFKLFMKKITELKCAWNDSLPDALTEEWKELASTFTDLRSLKISRHFLIPNYVTLELHGFSDASEKGYGAAIYIVSEDANGNRASHLVCAKSRVAPSAQKSIARLELCGAVVLSHLMEKVPKALGLQLQKKVAWMDSAIALHWMKKEPSQLQTYVANRISEIQELSTSTTWRHVRGEENPADLISRGLSPEDMIDNKMWWNGPDFLMNPENEWPSSIVQVDPENSFYKAEFKRILVITKKSDSPKENPFIAMSEASSRSFIVKRKLAFVLRFIFNVKTKRDNVTKRLGSISLIELQEAEDAIARAHQWEYFRDDFERLREGKSILTASRLKNLDPEWDANRKLLRVGGRLRHAKGIDNDQMHPVILPSDCQLTRQLARETHERAMHAGQQATHGLLKLKYWPLRANEIIRRECHKCIRCFRARPKLIQQFMGQLPEARVTPAPVFFNTGVDFAGPIQMKSGYLRNARPMKTYIAVFVCLATKAIHLEIVSELTTKAFLAALDRFTARRGLSANIFSDHGTNFVGAKNELKEIYNLLKTSSSTISEHLSNQEINWKFIPPRAPNQGGLWEAGVKSMKHHLLRATQNAFFNYEELSTVICRIEAILNSRPIIPLSDDPKDLGMLTNGHILIGRPLIAPPQRDFIEIPLSRRHRWDRITQTQQSFWFRWSREYLHQLQARTKDYATKTPIAVGQIVIIHQDDLPPYQWPLGRIVDIFPGKDGITRVAQIKTTKGICERPVIKLALVPILDNETKSPENVNDG